jgi:hypothetical protein
VKKVRKLRSIKENIKKFLRLVDKNILFNILKKIYNLKFFLFKNIFYLISNKNYNHKNIHYYNNSKNDLSILCEKYGSDKGYVDFSKDTPYGWKAHSYSNIYYNLFNHCKNEIKLIFECGIGTNNINFSSNMSPEGKPGASLRVWRDYFINSTVYGADIDRNILFEEDRIKTFYVDQLNKDSIKKLWVNINKNDFDIILDDGLHTFEAGITMFLNSFDKLRINGIYIIEDVNFSYINKLSKALLKYNPEIITLNNNLNKNIDNNLILIRKS